MAFHVDSSHATTLVMGSATPMRNAPPGDSSAM